MGSSRAGAFDVWRHALLPVALVGVVAASLFAAPLVPQGIGGATEPLAGYGPWQFGMSQAEVVAIDAHAPYDPVRTSIGGVETFTDLEPGLERISFVFNSADQLYMIRLWFDHGDDYDYDDVLLAFHRAYRHVTERFGSAQVDTGYPLEAGMSAEEFTALVPDRFAPTGEEFEMGADDAPRQFQMEQRLIRIAPLAQPPNARIFVAFIKMHPTTSYLVQVFYQGMEFTE